LYEKFFIAIGFYELTFGTASKSFDSPRIRTYFAIGIGVVGAILLIFGLIFSAYGFSSGVSFAFFGLIIIVVLIFYVVSTDGADTGKKWANTRESSIKSPSNCDDFSASGDFAFISRQCGFLLDDCLLGY
jgi:hypothetical protein